MLNSFPNLSSYQFLYQSASQLFSTASKGKKSLYTWGKQTTCLGYKTNTQNQKLPLKVIFPEDDSISVQKVFMGANHSAIITQKGELYMFGENQFGCLGLKDCKLQTTPKQVQFFAKHNLKVVDVICGEKHTLALTDDGDVWSWGYGGKKQNLLMKLFYSSCGNLGHGDTKHRIIPCPIIKLRDSPKIKAIASGLNFSFALDIENQLFQWGKGDYGVFGDGKNKSYSIPVKNDYLSRLKNMHGITIKKIKSNSNYTVALMSDGSLLSWGANENGQMGIKTEIGVELYETANFPTEVVQDKVMLENQIIDFEVGEDILVVLLSNNQVYWCGMKYNYQLQELKLPKNIGQIVSIASVSKAIGVLTNKNEIFMKNDFAPHENEDQNTGVSKLKQGLFEGKEVLQIGGVYKNRYAIVNK